MTTFKSQENMYEVLGGLFEDLLKDESVVNALQKAEVTTCFQLTDPEGKIWITADGRVLYGHQDTKATVTMILSGDTCHKFWLRKISMPLALAKGLIKAKGPMNKVLKLLPLMKPAFENYPAQAQKFGLAV